MSEIRHRQTHQIVSEDFGLRGAVDQGDAEQRQQEVDVGELVGEGERGRGDGSGGVGVVGDLGQDEGGAVEVGVEGAADSDACG